MPSILRVFRNPRAAWRGWVEGLRFRYLPQIANGLLDVTTRSARTALSSDKPLRVLVDSTIHHHAVTHESGWVSTGTKLWGGVVPIEGGYVARIPVYRHDSDKAAYQDIKYLPGIIHLARLGYIQLLTSAELEAERESQPNSRFRPTGYSDFSLLSGLRMESVDGRAWGTIYPGWRDDRQSPQDRQRARIEASEDATFQGLRDALGQRNSQDAWHIRTAEVHDIPYFLTMDGPLIRAMTAQAGHRAVKSLKARVVTPAVLGQELGIGPFPPAILSYNDASFPVRADFHMPGEQRRRRSTRRE